MATSRSFQPSSNPYASGAITLDSSPYTQFVLNKQAREEANQNAFLKSFQDLGNNINAAGLHQSDVPDVLTNKAKWQQYVMANQKEYNNPSLDNGKAYGEASRLYNEALAHVSQAKQKVLNLAEHAKVLQDPTKAGLLSEADHPNYERALLPVSTAGKENGYQPWVPDYTPKAFDELKYRNEISPLSQKVKIGTTLENDPNYKKNFRQTPVTEYKHNYDATQLASVAENKYAQDRSYRDLIKKIGENQVQYQMYNDIYKKEFGKNLDIQHPEQLAIAHTLSLIPKNFTERGTPTIDQKAYGDYKTKESERFRQKLHDDSMIHADKRAGLGGDSVGDYLEKSRTGEVFPGSSAGENVEVVKLPDIITKELKTSDGKPVEKVGLLNGKYFDIKLHKGTNTALDGHIDWSKTKEIPLVQIKSAIANKALPSNFKVKQVIGNTPGKQKIPNF